MLNRRQLLQGTAALGLLVPAPGALAQAAAPTPIIFLHGDSDQGSIWQNVIWRFETNGYPSDRMFAVDYANPQARDDDTKPQPNRSSTDEQLAELTAYVEMVKAKTGAAKVAMVALSRGGNSLRNYLSVPANVANVSHAVLGGTPNHGVFAIDALLGSEYNGHGAFLKRLNGGASEAVAGVAMMTLRSDGSDKYAQPDGRYIGQPKMVTNVLPDGPALTGATNMVLPGVDHRETALSPRAFRETYKFITGKEPDFIAIAPQTEITINGKVTGLVGPTPTNLPVAGANVEIYRVSATTGERIGEAVLKKTTAADGFWGPATVDSKSALEFVLTIEGHPITHIYRSSLPRSITNLNLRPAGPPAKEDADAAAIVTLARPRGYFGIPRDIILLDGKQPQTVSVGVPTDWTAPARLVDATARAVAGDFNEERIVGRPWPAKDNHRTILELTA